MYNCKSRYVLAIYKCCLRLDYFQKEKKQKQKQQKQNKNKNKNKNKKQKQKQNKSQKKKNQNCIKSGLSQFLFLQQKI